MGGTCCIHGKRSCAQREVIRYEFIEAHSAGRILAALVFVFCSDWFCMSILLGCGDLRISSGECTLDMGDGLPILEAPSSRLMMPRITIQRDHRAPVKTESPFPGTNLRGGGKTRRGFRKNHGGGLNRCREATFGCVSNAT